MKAGPAPRLSMPDCGRDQPMTAAAGITGGTRAAPIGSLRRSGEPERGEERLGRLELLSGELVIGQLGQEVVGEVRAAVAEIDVVGVLPNVEDEERLAFSRGERQAGIGGLGDLETPILTQHQPGPSGAELADRGGLERFLEFLDAAEVGGELLLEIAGNAAARGREAVPEEAVVPMLTRVVEDGSQILAAVSELDHFFERLALEGIILVHQAVERGDIRLMVLAMMELQGFLAHAAGGECSGRKRKRG